VIRFLVVGSSAQAIGYADQRGWTRIGMGRYVTPERDDVRVVERPMDVFFTPGGIVLERGPGFGENLEARYFEDLVLSGGARWVDGLR
jgi:hypothetical protein